MKRTIKNRTIRILLFAGFGFAILLLIIRHYYEATTHSTIRDSSQSVIQTIAVLNNATELTLALQYSPGYEPADTTGQIYYKKTPLIPRSAAIHALLDSLVSLSDQTPELSSLARLVQAEGKTVLQDGTDSTYKDGRSIQRLVSLLRTFRLALVSNLLRSQEKTRAHIATMQLLDRVIDGFLVLLASALLFVFYKYTLRRERLTKRVLERRNELTQYLEAIPQGVVVLNTDKQVVYVNQAAGQFLNVASIDIPVMLSELANRFRLSYADLKTTIEPADLPLSRALRGETITIDNLLLETENGPRLLVTHARPLFGQEGEIVGAISIFRDITEASRKEQELQQARTIAEQSLREREIFLANISHEIRTPLNAILGFAELLRQKRSVSDELEYLNGIKLSGNNLLALINELLDISLIESGQLDLEPVPTPIAEIIQAVEVNLTAKASEKGLRCEVVADPAIPPVLFADPVRLTQVLLNFCTNAIRHTNRGFVRFTVKAEESEQADPVILVFRIEDSGVGIDNDAIGHIFNRFSRVSEDTLFRSAGTGLGLNIAQSLVGLMRGTIEVQSQLNQGTIFTIRIPFAMASAGAESASVYPTGSAPVPGFSASRSSIDVLIVEDNKLNQKVVEGFLTRYQLRPEIAENGREAVEILEKKSFDLILMDIQMPEMDGYMATHTIRHQLGLQTPIIAMTAYTMPGERERCLAAGMNDYLAKPILIEQLDQILARYAPGLQQKAASSHSVNNAGGENELIDQAYLEDVTGGDTELLAELIDLFIRDLPQYRQVLFEAIANQDRASFNQTAHKFRSSLNSLAMLTIAGRLKKLEEDDLAFNLDLGVQLAGLFQDINRGLTLLENQLK